jgi:two-component system, LytTR family, sensor kinase
MSLHLHVEKDILTFKLINSAGMASPADGGGLGLQNVRRRLNLLYPGHQLKIMPAEDTFMVSLTLGLSGSKKAETFHSLRNDYYETELPVGR